MSTQATNTTTHYGLSQWAPNDRILREDFNADFSAIDSALHAHDEAIQNVADNASILKLIEQNAPIVKLYEKKGGTGSKHQIDVSGMDLTQFSRLELCVPLIHTNYSQRDVLLTFTGGVMDGDSGYLYSPSKCTDETQPFFAFRVILHHAGGGNKTGYGIFCECRWMRLSSLIDNFRQSDSYDTFQFFWNSGDRSLHCFAGLEKLTLDLNSISGSSGSITDSQVILYGVR